MPSDVTLLLAKLRAGDPAAANLLLPLVYEELRKLAKVRLAQEKPGQTLQATALVHEAYLRLATPSRRASPVDATAPSAAKEPRFDSRGHFFAAAAQAMRRILVEQARRKRRLKHGGGQVRLELQEADLACPLPDEDLLALDEAMARLAREDPLKAKLVELRFFAGLTNEEAAELLEISAVTAKRYWRYARAWLHRAVRGDGVPGESSGNIFPKISDD